MVLFVDAYCKQRRYAACVKLQQEVRLWMQL